MLEQNGAVDKVCLPLISWAELLCCTTMIIATVRFSDCWHFCSLPSDAKSVCPEPITADGLFNHLYYFFLLQVLMNMEDIKVREMQIFDYRKKIAESETKLKQQQNLYEAVRSDRNLYSKNLVEAQVKNIFMSLHFAPFPCWV